MLASRHTTAEVVFRDTSVGSDASSRIFGKKRLIPAAAVRQINVDDEKVFIDMTKDEVKDAPDYEEMWSEPDRREPYDAYYDAFRWPGI